MIERTKLMHPNNF